MSSVIGTSIDGAVEDLKRGKPVMLLDDIREHECDFIIAAEHVDDKSMAMFIAKGSGIVCLAMRPELANHLNLMSVPRRNAGDGEYVPSFACSIDAVVGVRSGVSAADRVRTIKTAVDPKATAHDLVTPGHVFPIVAHERGILGRVGHTEASLELMRVAGLHESAVLCEAMEVDSGEVAGMRTIDAYSRGFGIKIVRMSEMMDCCATMV